MYRVILSNQDIHDPLTATEVKTISMSTEPTKCSICFERLSVYFIIFIFCKEYCYFALWS